MTRAGRARLSEAASSVADLGTIVPILASLVLVNGVDPVAAMTVAGALFLVSALVYRIPIPVQPIKAAAAIAIARGTSAEVIAAAGLLIGVFLLVLALARAGPLLARLFPKPIIRGNQLGVGILLLTSSVDLAHRSSLPREQSLLVAVALLLALIAFGERRVPVALLAVAGGVAWTIVVGDASPSLAIAPSLPEASIPSAGAMLTALTLLVIPQIPLTLGNAIVGVSDLARDHYGARARPASPGRLALTSGAANVAAGVLGGMPVCHGSSGLTAYHRLGARGATVGVTLGVVLVSAGLLLGTAAIGAFALIPGFVLGGLLAYAGFRHATLVSDLRGRSLVVALGVGLVGGATRNLMIGLAAGYVLYLALGRPGRR